MEHPKPRIGVENRVNPRSSSIWESATSEKEARVQLRAFRSAVEKYGGHIDENTQILEIGSGNGALLKYAKNQGLQIVGIDARPRGPEDSPQVAAIAEQLPLADTSIDLVISAQAFEQETYLQDQERMLGEIVRVLKPGGLYCALFEQIDAPVPIGLELLSEKGDRFERVFRKR